MYEIRLYLVNKCNLKCSYCYENKQGKLNMLSIKDYLKVIDYLKKLNIKKIHFYGGEPLLNMKLINYIISENKLPKNINKYQITTNGTLLTKEIIYFLEFNNFQVNLSIDGVKEAHDLNRKFINGDGSFDTIIDKFKYMKNKRNYILSSVITPETVKNLFESIIFFKKEKFSKFDFTFLYEGDWNKENILTLYYQLKNIKIYLSLDKSFFYNTLNESEINCIKCMSETINIKPNLEVMPCLFWNSNIFSFSENFIKINKNIIFEKLNNNFNYFDYISNNVFSNINFSKIMQKEKLCNFYNTNKYKKNKLVIEKIINSIFC